MSAATKMEIRDCVEFVAQELAVAQREVARIENIVPRPAEGFIAEAQECARSLGRTQSIAFGVRTRLEFLEKELRRYLPGGAR